MVVEAVELAGDGCELWRTCLSCPLPVCFHELTRAEQQWAKARAHEIRFIGRIRTLATAGTSGLQIAAALGVSPTTVYRIAGAAGITFHGNGDAGQRRRGRARAGDGLTPELKAQIAARYAAGERSVDLAAAVGVSTTTVRTWVRAARAHASRPLEVV